MNEFSKSSSDEESKSESHKSSVNMNVSFHLYSQDYSAYEDLRIIGNGSFGVVYIVRVMA